jgi:hypothetical protein
MTQTISIRYAFTIDGMQLMSSIRAVNADTDWVPTSPTLYPQQVSGKLNGVAPAVIEKLRHANGAVALFKSRQYKFETLDELGSFTLRRAW